MYGVFSYIWSIFMVNVPSLKLKACPWKLMLGRRSFPFWGEAYVFGGELWVLGILWVIWLVSIQGTLSNLPAFHGTEARCLNAATWGRWTVDRWTSSTLCPARALQTSLESWNWQLRKERRKIWQVAIPKKEQNTLEFIFFNWGWFVLMFVFGKIREGKGRFVKCT